MNVYVSNYMFIYTQFANKPESIAYSKSDAKPQFASIKQENNQLSI